MSINITIIIIASAFVCYFSHKFAGVSSALGDYFHLPKSVKGATFDAIASSFPELMVALFSVIFFGQFDVGVGTIAGSALFNLLVIPGIAVLVAPVVFKVSAEVMHRDAIFYNIAVFALLAGLLYSGEWALGVPAIFLAIYAWYIQSTVSHSKNHKLIIVQNEATRAISLSGQIGKGIIFIALIAGATYFLTEHSILLAEALHVPAIIIAFTIIASATSLPDAVISITNARKGNIDDAASNVFGSNVFDILVGLGLPVLIAYFITGERVTVAIENLELILGLLGATILMIYFLAENHTLSRRRAWILLLLYAVFFTYAIYLGVRGI